jgi:hypothetical protein
MIRLNTILPSLDVMRMRHRTAHFIPATFGIEVRYGLYLKFIPKLLEAGRTNALR